MGKKYYIYSEITTAKKCVDLVFEDILSNIKIDQDYHDRMIDEFNNNGNRWESKLLIKGPKNDIYDLVFYSLERIIDYPNYDGSFAIRQEHDGTVVLYCFHRGVAHGLAVWRCRQDYFMIGYEEDLKYPEDFIAGRQVVCEYISYYDDQAALLTEFQSRCSDVHCQHCNRKSATSECRKISISIEEEKMYAIFECPRCKISCLASTDK